jgi:hypothetical protein
METHGSIALPVALGAADDFQIFLVNFFIVDLMLPYEVILTWRESQVRMAPMARARTNSASWSEGYAHPRWLA